MPEDPKNSWKFAGNSKKDLKEKVAYLTFELIHPNYSISKIIVWGNQTAAVNAKVQSPHIITNDELLSDSLKKKEKL